ncbi:peptidase family M28-domain-containing protein [Diplogelasinospora grovesii]|uniref:Peptide hydrolase n=1 Tax=Diplogelasinospora grovesii TaxID=303347 RepID=A0AAN6S6Y6_9PEZI|nr:peptidase family M28-domain-containing protein [Diplogelasinospora grovesii]
MACYTPLVLLFLVHILLAACLATAYTPLSDKSLARIPSGGGSDFDGLLAPILIPRVPGTPGSEAVRRHFVDFFTHQLPGDWVAEWHNSTSTTPATGTLEVPFSNLIFRRDPPWAGPGDVGRLTLVAHYDTLYRPEGFIGAIDSAAPCAMLMQVARGIDAALTEKWEEDMLASSSSSGQAGVDLGLEEEKGVQIVFMDGEEAWVSWTESDSLYGSRALAEHWESASYEGGVGSAYATPLQAISLFVLLDLLGAPNPHVPSYFERTHWAYQHLATVEERMRRLRLLETKKPDHGQFLPDSRKQAYQFSRGGYIQDDHVPFLERGVDVLHVIPNPFPPVWHTMDDDGQHLDIPTVRDWARIVTGFVAEWMDLEGHLPLVGNVGAVRNNYVQRSATATMRFSQSLASALLLFAAGAAASSWGFDDGSVSVAKKGADGIKEKLNQQTPISKPIALGSADTLKISLTAKDNGNAKRPHQAFVLLREQETGLEAPFPMTVKDSGKAVVSIAQKDIPVQLLVSEKPLKASIVIGSFGSAKGLDVQAFDLDIKTDPAAPPPSYEKPMRYGKRPEIHHIFRPDPKSPPKVISLVFVLAVIATVPALFIGWLMLGANVNHLADALGAAPLSHASFFGSIIAMEFVFFMYYTTWNLFQTLPVAAVVAAVTILSGSKALGEVQSRRLAGKR